MTGSLSGPALAAFRLGKAAARRGADLEAAEARYLRRHGHEHVNAWNDGWMSEASDG